MTLLPYLIALVLIFWFMVIRPQQRQRREMQTLLKELGVGADVMLTSGIFGRVSAVDDDAIHVEIAEGTVIRVIRGAIARIIPDESADDDEAGDEEAGDEVAAAHDPVQDLSETKPGSDADPEEH